MVVRIPKRVAKEADVSEGDTMEIETEEGWIQLRHSRKKIPSLRELVAQTTAENRYEAVEAGPEQGKETAEW